MKLYIDTSVLVKLYYPEPESERLEAWLRANRVEILLTPFHRLEMSNAFALKVHRGEATEEAYRGVIDAIREDLASNVLRAIQPDFARVLVEATALAEGQTPKLGTRSLDIVHVATARVLECASFLSADTRQLDLAGVAGLRAITIESLT